MVPLAVKANTTAMTTRRVPWAVAPLAATASLTVQPILPLPPHTFSCCIKREQLHPSHLRRFGWQANHAVTELAFRAFCR